MADEATEFWKAFESETGEKVEARGMGEWFRGGNEARGLWGLLILTDKTVRFKYMPSNNWFTSLIKRAGSDASDRERPIDIAIARENVTELIPPKRGFLARILGPAFPRFSLAARGDGGEERYIFSIDPSSGFLPALARILEKAGEAEPRD
jgi:hypothetical protein